MSAVEKDAPKVENSEHAAKKLERWLCRNPNCSKGRDGQPRPKILMEHVDLTTGKIVKICERCGTVNIMINGVPQE